ncbi:hypothetical protein P879_04924 [Paragonimus westermani]|uniref:Uncharacterized protein n=1 Tax=Paragonimus westermani TaxID=34504 RepID=A0A8T0DSG0_9TREM|nr:hypothetical protein P879_04924 [Paragonimus westermani]
MIRTSLPTCVNVFVICASDVYTTVRTAAPRSDFKLLSKALSSAFGNWDKNGIATSGITKVNVNEKWASVLFYAHRYIRKNPTYKDFELLWWISSRINIYMTGCYVTVEPEGAIRKWCEFKYVYTITGFDSTYITPLTINFLFNHVPIQNSSSPRQMQEASVMKVLLRKRFIYRTLNSKLITSKCAKHKNADFSFQIEHRRDLPILACCLEDTSFVQFIQLEIREYRIAFSRPTPLSKSERWTYLRAIIDHLATSSDVCSYNAYWINS